MSSLLKGMSHLRITVDDEGNVGDASALKSSGRDLYARPEPAVKFFRCGAKRLKDGGGRFTVVQRPLPSSALIFSVVFARLLAFGAVAFALGPALAAAPALQLVHALERRERPEAMPNPGDPRADPRRDDLLRRLVARRRFV